MSKSFVDRGLEHAAQNDAGALSIPPISEADSEWFRSSRNSPRVANQQSYPFEQSGEFCGGIARGVVHAAEGFIEFLAKPNSVSDALVAIGPELDTAVNYYANTDASQVGRDAKQGGRAVHGALAKYSELPPQQRGEIVGSLAAQVLAGELCGEVAMRPIRSGARDLSNALSPLDAKDYSHLPEDMQHGAAAVDRVIESAAKAERSMVRVSQLTGSVEHAQHVQRIVDALPPELQSMLAQSGLKIKTVERVQDIISTASGNTRARIEPYQGAIYVAEQFQRRGQWMSEAETLTLVLRHELGHVIDRAGGFSNQKSMMDAYFAGCRRLSFSQRRELGYLATADQHGCMEAFAEVYAQLKTPGAAAAAGGRKRFRSAFPEMFEAISKLNLP